MSRIINCCYPDLNKRSSIDEPLGNDITTEITVGISPLILLSVANLNRKIIKIFTVNYSDILTRLWVQHGTNVSVNNFGFALPKNHLYFDNLQASRPLSLVTNVGTALIKFTVVNKS
jgi:hypothetical protein